MHSDNNFYYKKNRLNQLRGFCAVVQSGCSGVKAAEKTNIEPAAISKQISTLERDLGTKLFERSRGHKLLLTKEGELFYELAIKELQGMDSLFESFNEHLKDFNDNHLNIALHYTAMSYIFPKILGKLTKQERFKDVNIKLFEITKNEAITKLTNKEIDLAFYPFNVNENIPTEIEAEKNIKYSHIIICNKIHPLANKKTITKEDIKKYDFLLRNENSFLDMSKYLDLKPCKITFENAKIETTIELVKYTNAITTLSEITFDEENAKLNPDVIKINVDNLFPESYFYTMRLKNSLRKDSVGFVLEELDRLVIKK